MKADPGCSRQSCVSVRHLCGVPACDATCTPPACPSSRLVVGGLPCPRARRTPVAARPELLRQMATWAPLPAAARPVPAGPRGAGWPDYPGAVRGALSPAQGADVPTPSSTKPTQGTGSLNPPRYLLLREDHFRARGEAQDRRANQEVGGSACGRMPGKPGGPPEVLGCGLHSQACRREAPRHPNLLDGIATSRGGGKGRGCEKGKHTGVSPPSGT